MADNNGSNIVAIFAILVIVIVAGALVYFLVMKGEVSTPDTTVITQPTKVVEPASSNQ